MSAEDATSGFPLGDTTYYSAEDRRDGIKMMVEQARRLTRDPNWEKSGYAPRKATLANQVVVLGRALLEAESNE